MTPRLEQLLIARRVESLGVGLWAPPDKPIRIGAKAVALVHETGVREASARFTSTLDSQDAPHEVMRQR